METFVSIHVPKAAGTHFRAQIRGLPFDAFYFVYAGLHPESGLWLRANGDIGSKHRSWAPRVTESIKSGGELVRRLMVHGHVFARDYLDAVEPKRFISWVRDPVERVASHYYFWKRVKVPDDPNWARFDREGWSLAEFAAQAEFRNMQTRYLAGLTPSEMGFLGLVERYDEGIARLEAMFGVKLPVRAERANVNPDKKQPRYDLDAGLRRTIAEANADDVALYAEAQKLWK